MSDNRDWGFGGSIDRDKMVVLVERWRAMEDWHRKRAERTNPEANHALAQAFGECANDMEDILEEVDDES